MISIINTTEIYTNKEITQKYNIDPQMWYQTHINPIT